MINKTLNEMNILTLKAQKSAEIKLYNSLIAMHEQAEKTLVGERIAALSTAIRILIQS